MTPGSVQPLQADAEPAMGADGIAAGIDGAQRIVFFFALLATLISAIPLLWAWQAPSPAALAMLIGAGLSATVGQLMTDEVKTVAVVALTGVSANASTLPSITVNGGSSGAGTIVLELGDGLLAPTQRRVVEIADCDAALVLLRRQAGDRPRGRCDRRLRPDRPDHRFGVSTSNRPPSSS